MTKSLRTMRMMKRTRTKLSLTRVSQRPPNLPSPHYLHLRQSQRNDRLRLSRRRFRQQVRRLQNLWTLFLPTSFAKDLTPPSPRTRSLSPSHTRRSQLRPSVLYPRSYTVEAICALPHPVPTHSLAATPCMAHLLTGSEDGYIRDYDIFSAVNGKTFLTAPQRHHAGVVEGTLKAGQVRSWWENQEAPVSTPNAERLPVHSLSVHGDALWCLSGSNTGTCFNGQESSVIDLIF